VLTLVGTLAVGAAFHAHTIPGVVASYLAHAWLAVIALTWYFLLRRRFPVGTINERQLRPWSVLALALVAVNVIGTIASPDAGLRIPSALRSSPSSFIWHSSSVPRRNRSSAAWSKPP
jgi:hypothetical protein